MASLDRWRCPFCDSVAQGTTPHGVICDSKTCSCGAIALGAPQRDFDEVVDDAISLFGVSPQFLTEYDCDRVAGLNSRGVEVRRGWRDHNSGTERFQYWWFRKSATA